MGWAPHEMNIYLGLIREGPMTKRDVASLLEKGVNSQTLAGYLSRLEGRGAVTMAESGQRTESPMVYPEPPEEVFMRMMENSQDLHHRAVMPAQDAYEKSIGSVATDADWAVHGERGTARILQNSIGQAVKRVLIHDEYPRWCRASQIAELARKMNNAESPTDVAFIIGANSPTKTILQAKGIPFTAGLANPTRFMVVDDTVYLIREDGRGAHRSRDPPLVKHFTSLFLHAHSEVLNAA